MAALLPVAASAKSCFVRSHNFVLSDNCMFSDGASSICLRLQSQPGLQKREGYGMRMFNSLDYFTRAIYSISIFILGYLNSYRGSSRRGWGKTRGIPCSWRQSLSD